MNELLIEYKEQILLIFSFISLPFVVFLISLSSVYLLGRMFNIVKKDVTKNIIAYITMLSSYIFYFFWYSTKASLYQKIWYVLIYSAVSIVMYVLLGFKMYSRVDALLDKIATDKEKKPPRRKASK